MSAEARQRTAGEGIDWGNEQLRKAAVEYALQQAGECPGRPDRRGAWLEKLRPVAAALGVESPLVLQEWILTKSLQPEYADRPGLATRHRTDRDGQAAFLAADVQTWDDKISGAAAALAEVVPGALPAPVTDPLAALLQEEDGVLSREEREELAASLETGAPLERAQRLALACLLRGSDLAGRRETVRAVLDWVAPDVEGITTIWELRETTIQIPRGCRWRYEEQRPWLTGRGLHGKCRLVIESATGDIHGVRLFTRVRRVREGAAGTAHVTLTYLAPVEKFARDHVLHQFALLASLVRREERDGQEWGRLFGVKSGKALVSYHRKRLKERIQQDTGGGKTGFRGLKNTVDPRKGKRRSREGGAA